MRTFLIIWLGQLISMIGSGMTSFALGVWIYQLTGDATPFALTVLFGTLPRILLFPLAGSLADRADRRKVMILADSGVALVTLSAAILLFFSSLQIWHVFLIAGLGSAFSAFQEPAYTASITMLVPKKELARASGMVQMGSSVEMLVSPLLAGLLFGVIGLRGIMLIDFATFFFALGALLVVQIPQPKSAEVDPKQRGKVWRDTKLGWKYLRARPGLFGLLWYYALVNFLLNFAAVLRPPLVLSFSNPGVLGLIDTISGGAMLLGGIVLSTWGGPKSDRIRAVIGFIALGGIGLLIAGLRPSPIFIGLGMFIMLFSVPMASGPSQAIFQTKVEPGVQGRVFAVRNMISRSMMPVAFLIAGPLADRFFDPLMSTGGILGSGPLGSIFGVGPGRGMGLMFSLSGVILVIVSALNYLNPRIRRVEIELPDMLPEKPDTQAELSLPGEGETSLANKVESSDAAAGLT